MTNYNRRAFLQKMTLLGGVLTAGSFITPRFIKAENRPLEALAIGDSVVWGQGLKTENKFTTLVCNWLSKETGRLINFHREAHSGATIYPKVDTGRKYHGEINISSPSIFQQLKNSTVFYQNRPPEAGGKLSAELVDLIFVDGGINDMHATKILFSRPKTIRKEAEKHCYKRMKELLAEIKQTYPNARIVATGYFPLISMESNRSEVIEAVTAILGENKIQKEVVEFARNILDNVPDNWRKAQKDFSERSDTWFVENNNQMEKAVNEVNKDENSSRFSTSNPRILFVKAPFEPQNAYAVDKTTFLWRIRAKTQTDDEMFDERSKKICQEVKDNPFTELLTCPRAAAFHPNVEGAKAYAEKIIGKLKPVLEKTGWKS